VKVYQSSSCARYQLFNGRVPRAGRYAWILVAGVISCTAGPAEKPTVASDAMRTPLLLDTALEPERALLDASVRAAVERVRMFAARNEWQALTRESFMDSVRIFDRKPDFDHALLSIAGMDTATALPATYSAVLENRVLLAVSPRIYAANYPQGQEDQAYEKLLAHEMAHRLHVRILQGNEEAMGPTWFYEGFALFAADQFASSAEPVDTNIVWETVASDERGDYRRYAVAFRYFAQRIPLPDLIAHAGEREFTHWLRAALGR
jgi:hypothetical protein